MSETLPPLYLAAAEGDGDAVRGYIVDAGLFGRQEVRWLVPTAFAFSSLLVAEQFGGPPDEAALAQFSGELPAQKIVAPVPLADDDLNRLLQTVNGQPLRYPWQDDPYAFEVRDLSALVVIGGVAIRQAGWKQPRIEGLYRVVHRAVEAKFGVRA
ncbi:hypothetical protein [Jatrophihabitans sp.]|uniref:hypothetical protein n=1 Tax=Jatrophihabitans sp. TaxID=1932789 RepID=UPI0030C718FA